MKQGLKHLVECHCVLPQFRDSKDPVYHRFVVFTELDDDDNIVVKHAQCNNCGVIHRITDICKSEIIMGKETSVSLMSINDIKLSIPQQIASVLESYNADLATWEAVLFTIENERWGTPVVLTSEDKSGQIDGKCLRVTGPSTAKIEAYSMSLNFP